MPLPDSDSRSAWPPATWAPFLSDVAEAAAWYSGDTKQLAALYGGRPDEVKPTIAERARFWATGKTATNGQPCRQLHAPAAADVAATSADLLFGEEATLTIAAAHDGVDLDADGNPTTPTGERAEAVATEDRLQELLELDGTASTLLEGAEICAALGGVYLRPVWDDAVADHPILNVVHPDHAVPEFRWGELMAVTFWKVLQTEGSGVVWRHLERHEMVKGQGSILHGLYIGTKENLGRKVSLDAHPDTAALAGTNSDGVVQVPEGIEGLLVRYVPNVRPNRRHRGRPVGRSDLQGSESFMDALDETWSSWMRDIRLGKRRIIVPDQYLTRGGRGQGASFDLDAEVFTPLEMEPSVDGDKGKSITPIDFDIRTEAHYRTCSALFAQIVTTAGYSAQTFGLQGDGSDQTATESRAREGKSLRTTGRKQRYWRRAVEDVGEMMLIIDSTIFGSQIKPMRPSLKWGDALGADVRQMAETMNQIRMARAASTETLVQMLHPEWDPVAVQTEVQRIKDDEAVADPTGGFP